MHAHRRSSEERWRLRRGNDDLNAAVFGRHGADLHCRLFLGHDVDRIHSYLRRVHLGQSRLETADYSTAHYYWLQETVQSTTIYYHYWRLCRAPLLLITGDCAERYCAEHHYYYYWRLCRALLCTAALLIITGDCAEHYCAEHHYYYYWRLCRALLSLMGTGDCAEYYYWGLDTIILVTAELRTYLISLRVRTNAARLRFCRTYGQQNTASARVSTSIGTPLRCYGSRTVAGRRSRESGTG